MRPMRRQAAPTSGMSRRAAGAVVLELRGALGHERVALADEGAVLELARDDHLAPVAERVRDRARVADRHGLRALAVLNLEEQRGALVADRAGHDLAGHLGAAATAARREDLGRRSRLGRAGEARVEEGACQ